jgi:hypothetical protein
VPLAVGVVEYPLYVLPEGLYVVPDELDSSRANHERNRSLRDNRAGLPVEVSEMICGVNGVATSGSAAAARLIPNSISVLTPNAARAVVNKSGRIGMTLLG